MSFEQVESGELAQFDGMTTSDPTNTEGRLKKTIKLISLAKVVT